jgi:hypothetical protein
MKTNRLEMEKMDNKQKTRSRMFSPLKEKICRQ